MSEKDSFVGATGQPGEYRRVTAADVRRKLDVFTPPPADLDGTARRPTISGPSSGCPFLLDARQNAAFTDLALDPERTQTKGCSFCLDNFGAYVVPSESAVLAAWLEGVRRIRAARPDAREILLTDERPHRYLPAFFAAIAADPSLGSIELLWKSRADWLLEFAADVARACEVAARSGSVVHLYLMGFENFDRAHLELFNKGHGPEVSERAIELMRDLQRRFPESFEHRRYRSHGILLFTPWTAPEALLENARWMRRLRFHELRAEAVKTRLRLYPRVPLHRLAERDGLLAERFAAGRGDRAAEQGYDASLPWRFRDPRTEAIFQLANALHEADRTIADCDLIEVATRFVLRWPGLATEPQLAALPLLAAIETWGAPLPYLLRELGPAAVAFDPEIEAIGVTSKRAALKESVRAGDAGEMVRAYRAMGFAAALVQRHALESASGAHGRGAERAMIAVAADEATLAELLLLQRDLASTKGAAEQAAAVAALGALMGYPPCCAAAFGELAERGDNLQNERIPFARRPDEPLHPLLHRTGAVRLLSHHLCSPSCAASIELASRLLERLAAAAREGSPETSQEAAERTVAARLLRVLSLPSLFIDYERCVTIEGAWEGDAFRLERVHAVGRCPDFEALLAGATSLRPQTSSLRIAVEGAPARDVPAASPVIFVPGQRLNQIHHLAVTFTTALTGAATHPKRQSLPPLPAALRAGVRVAAFMIAAIESSGEVCTITLARERERFTVRLRAHAEGAPFTMRKGPWACDVEAPQQLSEPARAALTLLVRALPG